MKAEKTSALFYGLNFSPCAWLPVKAEIICQSQKGFLCSSQWEWGDPDRHIHRPPGHNSRGRHSGGGSLLEWSHQTSAEPTLCGGSVGNKINTKNLYQVKLISKYCGSRVGVEVVGGAVKSLFPFHAVPYLGHRKINVLPIFTSDLCSRVEERCPGPA